MKDNIEIYVDSSFNPQTKIAVCGWMLDGKIDSMIIKDTTCTEAEILGIIHVLGIIYVMNPNCNVIIYSDCQTAVNLITKRRYNKEIYTKLFEYYDKCKDRCQIIKVQGHKKKSLRNEIENNFSKLDIAVRKKLRSI